MTNLQFKMGNDGFTALYQIEGRGPWRKELPTANLLPVGVHTVFDGDKAVGLMDRKANPRATTLKAL